MFNGSTFLLYLLSIFISFNLLKPFCFVQIDCLDFWCSNFWVLFKSWAAVNQTISVPKLMWCGHSSSHCMKLQILFSICARAIRAYTRLGTISWVNQSAKMSVSTYDDWKMYNYILKIYKYSWFCLSWSIRNAKSSFI